MRDAEQAVCLLVEDGLMIVFAHRSFQEYFVARFICNAKPETQQKLIDKYGKTIYGDSVMELLYEMNPELVERHLIIPGIEKLEKYIKVKRKVGITHYLRYLKSEFSTIEFKDNNILGSYANKTRGFVSLISFALIHCGNLIGWDGYGEKSQDELSLLRKYTAEGKTHTIFMSRLTYKDEIVKDLAVKGRFFSLNTIELAISIKNALIKKHQDLDNSLDEILTA